MHTWRCLASHLATTRFISSSLSSFTAMASSSSCNNCAILASPLALLSSAPVSSTSLTSERTATIFAIASSSGVNNSLARLVRVFLSCVLTQTHTAIAVSARSKHGITDIYQLRRGLKLTWQWASMREESESSETHILQSISNSPI